MEELLTFLYDNDNTVTIVLATLPPTGSADVNPYVFLLNQQYRSLAVAYKAQGKRIQLAEMNNGFIKPETDLTPGDILHPNNGG